MNLPRPAVGTCRRRRESFIAFKRQPKVINPLIAYTEVLCNIQRRYITPEIVLDPQAQFIAVARTRSAKPIF